MMLVTDENQIQRVFVRSQDNTKNNTSRLSLGAICLATHKTLLIEMLKDNIILSSVFAKLSCLP